MTFNLLKFIKACFRAWHPSRHLKPTSSAHRADHYNTRVRTNIDRVERHPERPENTTSNTSKHPRAESSKSQYISSLPVTTPYHPRIKPRGRFARSKMQWSTSNMSRAELAELFNLVHAALEHVPYAICGLAALNDYELTDRQANKVSIICPRTSRKNVMGWAATKGYEVHAGSVGIPTSDGSVRRVRVKFVEHGFEALQRVRSTCSNATVLSVTSLLDNVAAGWLDNKRRGDERALAVIANDIFSCLDNIAARREGVDSIYLPTFLGEVFFTDFTACYDNARPEMARAGIDVGAVLAKHRDAASLREHDEMLRQYGCHGDSAPREPRGQFEEVRASVYTIRDKDFPHEATVGRMPTTAQPPRQAYHFPGRSGMANGSTSSNLIPSLATRRNTQPKPVEKPDGNWI
ncbi:hypothetical protein F4680DRAFT_465806 [Xylaria scruposa]|nr:hypothetical protein F4680DRAFT_465806 [Xylaria scruposa]